MPEHQSAGNRFAMSSLDRTLRQLEEAKEAVLISEDVDAARLTDEPCTIEKDIIFNWRVSEDSFDTVEYARRIMKNHLTTCQPHPGSGDSAQG